MISSSFLVLVFVSFACSQAPSGYYNTLVIDDFEVETTSLIIVTSTHNIPSTVRGYTQDYSILGGEREIDLSVLTGSTNLVLSTGVSNGFFSVSSPNGVSGKSSLIYDGIHQSYSIDPSGLNVDFTQNGSVALGAVFESDTSIQVTFTIFESGQQCSLTLEVPPGPNYNSYTLLFSDFSGSCSFTNVGALELVVPFEDYTSFESRSISLIAPIPSTVSPIPVPSSVPSGNDFVCCFYYSSFQQYKSSFCQENGFRCPGVDGFMAIGNTTSTSCLKCSL